MSRSLLTTSSLPQRKLSNLIVENSFAPASNLGFGHTNKVDSLKIKRPQTARAFRKQIDDMYEEITRQGELAKAKL